MVLFSGRLRTVTIYVVLAIVPAVLGVVIAAWWADPGTPHQTPTTPSGEIPGAGRLLFAVAVVSLATVAGGLLARLVRQPVVVGQMVVGIVLGPSVLGALAPGVESWLFPEGTASILVLLGGMGAIFFIFLVGLDFSVAELRRSAPSIVAVGHGATAIPFLAGSVLAIVLAGFGELPEGGVAVNLFLAVAMSVTALPVLAAILRERGLDQTRVGTLGIGASVVGNATGWAMLAVTLAIATSTSTVGAVVAGGLVVLFGLFMWYFARPALAALDRRGTVGPALPALALSVLLLAAFTTDSLGVDAVVGAFLAGLILPRSAGFRMVNSKIEGLTEWLLLPMFFVASGLQTEIGTLGSARDFLLCLLILIVAVGSKVLGTILIARGVGIGWLSTAMLAAMMNCRGITELIVLNVGLHAGLLDRKLFTILTIMAIVTTIMTAPALDLIARAERRRAAQSTAAQTSDL
ncbi:MAG TPA: cation:proton antiporter [Actinophytocola sp.]|uniref:cation:proton antiporter domain-containing protein n=1 Tax=Actinophytocola sp. TaxID=1872138 RepID=UPI002DB849FC|nr:cation:proton antiporter [Actinophytocola sp.]HEU5473376.1 cation:proton antiporter [Actinophytocola sp.]